MHQKDVSAKETSKSTTTIKTSSRRTRNDTRHGHVNSPSHNDTYTHTHTCANRCRIRPTHAGHRRTLSHEHRCACVLVGALARAENKSRIRSSEKLANAEPLMPLPAPISPLAGSRSTTWNSAQVPRSRRSFPQIETPPLTALTALTACRLG